MGVMVVVPIVVVVIVAVIVSCDSGESAHPGHGYDLRVRQIAE